MRTAQDAIAFGKAQARDALSQNAGWRQAAVANFILAHARMASDLSRLLDAQRNGGGDAIEKQIAYLEVRLREEFVRYFGHDMIALPAGYAACPKCGASIDAHTNLGDGRIEFDCSCGTRLEIFVDHEPVHRLEVVE